MPVSSASAPSTPRTAGVETPEIHDDGLTTMRSRCSIDDRRWAPTPPPVPTTPKPVLGSGRQVASLLPPGTGRESLPPPPPTPAGSGYTPAPTSTEARYAPKLPAATHGSSGRGALPPPIDEEDGIDSLPPPPPLPTTPKPSSMSSRKQRVGSTDDSLPPPPSPSPLTEVGGAKRRTNRLSHLTMPPPRMSVCIIDTSFDAVDEEEPKMPPPPPAAMAPPPPPPPPLPPPETSLPPPPPMESGFALRTEPARRASQQKKCESRGDLLTAIRKGQSPV